MSKKGDTAKGNRIEREFFLKLQEMGFVVWKAGRKVIWIPGKSGLRPITMSNDIHGIFDLHAKHPSCPEYNFWFQIAANAWKSGEDRKAIEVWPSGGFDVVCMVRKMDRKPFEIKRFFLNYRTRIEGHKPIEEYSWNDFGFEEFFNDVKSKEVVKNESN